MDELGLEGPLEPSHEPPGSPLPPSLALALLEAASVRPPDHPSLPDLKGAAVLHILSNRMGEESFRLVIQQLVQAAVKPHIPDPTGAEPPPPTHPSLPPAALDRAALALATKARALDTAKGFFREVARTSFGAAAHAFQARWVTGAGCPTVTVAFAFDRKAQDLTIALAQEGSPAAAHAAGWAREEGEKKGAGVGNIKVRRMEGGHSYVSHVIRILLKPCSCYAYLQRRHFSQKSPSRSNSLSPPLPSNPQVYIHEAELGVASGEHSVPLGDEPTAVLESRLQGKWGGPKRGPRKKKVGGKAREMDELDELLEGEERDAGRSPEERTPLRWAVLDPSELGGGGKKGFCVVRERRREGTS